MIAKLTSIAQYKAKRLKKRVSYIIRKRKYWQKHVIQSTAAVTGAIFAVMTLTGVLFFGAESGQALPALSYNLNESEHGELSREISYRERTHIESLPYETSYEYTDLLAMSESIVVAEGVYGERTVVLRERLVNGEVVSSEVLSSERTREPETRIVTQGRALQTPMSRRDFPEIRLENGIPVDFVQKLTGRATAYTAAPTARTSTGRPLEVGIVAVDPRIIPYGSLMYIVSTCGSRVYGAAVAADTGAFIHWPNPTLIDIFVGYTNTENHNLALCWGIRDVDVYIINTGIY
jgi:3D (Asp-Asp-Asp) domain-containing protein